MYSDSVIFGFYSLQTVCLFINLLLPSHFLSSACAMDAAMKKAQDRWSKKLLSDEKYCDAVAVLREGQRVPFVRPLLASLSPPLDTALYLVGVQTWLTSEV